MLSTDLLLTVVLLCGGARWLEGAELPSGFEKCKRDDVECLARAIQSAVRQLKGGLPSHDLPPIDPFVTNGPDVAREDANGVKSELTLKKSSLGGHGEALVTAVKIDRQKLEVKIEVMIPHPEAHGEYTLDATVNGEPLVGSGNYNMTAVDLPLTIILEGDADKKLSGIKVDVGTPQLFSIYLDNLYGGDQAKGDAVNKMFNDTWKERWNAVRPVAVRSYQEGIVKYAKAIFAGLTTDDVYAKA